MTITATRLTSRPRLSLATLSTVWRPRIVIINLALAVIATIAFGWSIAVGDYPLSLMDVGRIIFGGGEGLESIIVFDWRMPRALTGIIVGAAFGLAGAITQSVTRNALASPDVLGITAGASAGAVTVIVLGGGATSGIVAVMAGIGIPLSAFLGALATGVVIWILGSHRGMDTFRLVLSGIIVSALLAAYTSWLLIRADLNDAATAQVWLTGSVGSASYEKLLPVGVVLACSLPVIVWIAFHLQAVVLGDDSAKSLGVRVTLTQMMMLLLSVLLSAVAVAAAGPIGFVAFVSPQVAKRLTGTPTPPMTASMLTGGVIVVVADLVTRTVLPVELPVGVLTSIIGGIFLIYLLIRSNRRTTV